VKSGDDRFAANGLGAAAAFSTDDLMIKMGTGDDSQVDMGDGKDELVLHRCLLGNGFVVGLQHDLTVRMDQGGGVFCLRDSSVNGGATILLGGLAVDEILLDLESSQVAEN
jgi:hypothetical protein